jgi:hypothetical protein
MTVPSREPPCATWCGRAFPNAMQMTGHKTRSVFERYNIVSVGDLREAGRRLDIAAGTISGTIGQDWQIGTKTGNS